MSFTSPAPYSAMRPSKASLSCQASCPKVTIAGRSGKTTTTGRAQDANHHDDHQDDNDVNNLCDMTSCARCNLLSSTYCTRDILANTRPETVPSYSTRRSFCVSSLMFDPVHLSHDAHERRPSEQNPRQPSRTYLSQLSSFSRAAGSFLAAGKLNVARALDEERNLGLRPRFIGSQLLRLCFWGYCCSQGVPQEQWGPCCGTSG